MTVPSPPPRTCIVLICSIDYLLYSLVCARQAKAHAPAGTDVRIFLDAPASSAAIAARASQATGVSVDLAPEHLIAAISGATPHAAHFINTHLNRSSLLRLKICDLLGDRYDRVLYLDGDVQVRGSLGPLLSMNVPDGKFLAVRDWKAHQSHPGMPQSDAERAALTRLGLPEEKWSRYFNSGMLLGGMAAWRDIGRDALDFYMTYPERCATYDQCALNAVAIDRVELISPRWNFLRGFMPLPIYRSLNPAILHFAAPPKPWVAALPPWGREGFAPYAEMAALLYDLNLPWRRYSLQESLRWRVRSRLRPDFPDPAYRARIEALLRQDEPAT